MQVEIKPKSWTNSTSNAINDDVKMTLEGKHQFIWGYSSKTKDLLWEVSFYLFILLGV